MNKPLTLTLEIILLGIVLMGCARARSPLVAESTVPASNTESGKANNPYTNESSQIDGILGLPNGGGPPGGAGRDTIPPVGPGNPSPNLPASPPSAPVRLCLNYDGGPAGSWKMKLIAGVFDSRLVLRGVIEGNSLDPNFRAYTELTQTSAHGFSGREINTTTHHDCVATYTIELNLLAADNIPLKTVQTNDGCGGSPGLRSDLTLTWGGCS